VAAVFGAEKASWQKTNKHGGCFFNELQNGNEGKKEKRKRGKER